ncbi:DUF3365 domain-containing protein [Acetonema longum]|uniref:Circadian input-output histidine kinase CikA n=1 Tax=Acetonema longum DSM 6540 TaxID=1009370 RepID=F7NFH5_9FIRM|nr:DUF3365 domain-containing protein [Acetonema longum]EGO65230.1 histidine kinase [Acetonema longum DSM 6540]
MIKLKNSLTMKFMLGTAAIMTVMMTVNLLWSLSQYKRQAEAEMKEKAMVITQQLIATRAFIAAKQDAINCDAIGNYEFKHLNPAAVGKGIGDIFNQYSGYRLKQTRLQPRDPANAPDNYETEMLAQLALDRDLPELWGYDQLGGVRVFRYMVPLYYDPSCMPCHGKPAGASDIAGFPKEGRSPGDFAGAISVVVPMTAFEANINANIVTQVSFILLMILASIGGIYLMMEHIVVVPIKELTGRVLELGEGNWAAALNEESTYDEMRYLASAFNSMADRLQQLYNELEGKVAERTRLLYEANRKLIEQGRELREMNARLCETDRLKSEFLAVMSHELRTPLTAIIAFAEIMLAEGQALNELQREYLEDIFESAHQLLGQINDILDMSKMEAGLIRLNCQPVDIPQLLESITRITASLIARKNLGFTVGIAPDVPLISADYEKLSHILRNLISNAIKFTPAGGEISVVVEMITSGCDTPKLQVLVKDTGIGISPSDQTVIFETFRQADAACRREYAGSGLGLAIARNLVELHGGEIWVESSPDEGSIFGFTIPASIGGDEYGGGKNSCC